MKVGDKVRLVKKLELQEYQFYPRLKQFKTLTIRYIKESGGLLFEELVIGYNMFGVEQGIFKGRFKVIPKRKPSPLQSINKEFLRILKKRK